MADVTLDKSVRTNVVLIGFMGTGKTSIGKLVACSLGYKFVDTDAMIVKRAGKPITRIFADDGEEAFRDLETAVLRDLGERKKLVISTGGGIVLREENRKLLRDAGYSVWLTAAPETIYGRVVGNRDRPLLKTKSPRETITTMMAEREALYSEASDLKVETDNLSLDEVGYGVVECARMRFGE